MGRAFAAPESSPNAQRAFSPHCETATIEATRQLAASKQSETFSSPFSSTSSERSTMTHADPCARKGDWEFNASAEVSFTQKKSEGPAIMNNTTAAAIATASPPRSLMAQRGPLRVVLACAPWLFFFANLANSRPRRRSAIPLNIPMPTAIQSIFVLSFIFSPFLRKNFLDHSKNQAAPLQFFTHFSSCKSVERISRAL